MRRLWNRSKTSQIACTEMHILGCHVLNSGSHTTKKRESKKSNDWQIVVQFGVINVIAGLRQTTYKVDSWLLVEKSQRRIFSERRRNWHRLKSYFKANKSSESFPFQCIMNKESKKRRIKNQNTILCGVILLFLIHLFFHARLLFDSHFA